MAGNLAGVPSAVEDNKTKSVIEETGKPPVSMSLAYECL